MARIKRLARWNRAEVRNDRALGTADQNRITAPFGVAMLEATEYYKTARGLKPKPNRRSLIKPVAACLADLKADGRELPLLALEGRWSEVPGVGSTSAAQ